MQLVSKEQAYEAIKQRFLEDSQWCQPQHLEYWAWPQVFGSTAGPFGGIGGQAMTTFTIEAWSNGLGGEAVLFCHNKILKVVKEWEGPCTVRL